MTLNPPATNRYPSRQGSPSYYTASQPPANNPEQIPPAVAPEPVINPPPVNYGQPQGTGVIGSAAPVAAPSALPTEPASALDYMPYQPYVRTRDGYTYPTIAGDPTPDFAWYVLLDAQPLMRDVDDDFDFQGLSNGDNIILNSRDLDSDFETGGRFLVGVDLSPRYSVEASYIGVSDWNDSTFVRDSTANAQGGNGDLVSPFSDFGDPPTVGVDFNEFAQIAYVSKFDNFELNLRHELVMPEGPYEIFFLYGIRYAKVREQFAYRTESSSAGGSINQVGVEAVNNLFAVQLGTLVQLRVHDYWGIELDVKGALAHNDASQQTRYFNRTGAVDSNFFTQREENRTTFIGDISLAANYNFSPALTLRFGYHATVISGVALGADNFETDLNNIQLGPGQLDHDGEILYHGPQIGVVWRH